MRRTITQWLTTATHKPCRGCRDRSFHTHHLTIYGRWRYIWRHQLRALAHR